jgi:hypothetical protein
MKTRHSISHIQITPAIIEFSKCKNLTKYDSGLNTYPKFHGIHLRLKYKIENSSRASIPGNTNLDEMAVAMKKSED